MSAAKNSASLGLILVLPVIVSAFYFMQIHNGLVAKEESVLQSWAQVESNYQRRADLIPNLVSTVKGFMKQEHDVLLAVTKERSKTAELEKAVEDLLANHKEATDLTENAKARLGDDDYMKQLAMAQMMVGKNVQRIFGLVENYPQLRSAENMLALQYQLEGTENRINVARMQFNEEVGEFNAAIRKIPASLVAGMGGFQRKAYFKADEGAAKAVKVQF
ncbi:MAG: LemA family protein [Alphaproteobacteria bacterium]|nr:MAG: LemA family protein [Alphaproteobacteria bacterium]